MQEAAKFERVVHRCGLERRFFGAHTDITMHFRSEQRLSKQLGLLKHMLMFCFWLLCWRQLLCCTGTLQVRSNPFTCVQF